jgi:S-adenosylmethionine-diacylglycerol 3-amino-3-carboxypropyl transferase
VTGKWFSLMHGHNLVYNTCWEDPRLDRIALNLGQDDVVLMITSAGCNALDYALDGPGHIYAVDMNPRQNALLELKIAAIRALDFEDFFAMFGQGRCPGFENLYNDKLRPQLSPWPQKYWDRHTHFFDGSPGFYFCGSAGWFARCLNYYIDRIVRIRDDINALIDAPTLEEQQRIYESSLRDAFWNGFLRRIIGSHAALALVGVPRQQRQQVEYHFGRSVAEFIEWCIETVFTQLPIQDNYFWRVYLRGEYSQQCCPEYLKPENFFALKDGLVDAISVHTDTVEGLLRQVEQPVSRFVLLDHMDWLSAFNRRSLQSEWQAILDCARRDARVIFRSGCMKVDYVDPIPVIHHGHTRQLGEMLHYHRQLAAQLHERDRVHTYGSFYIADLMTA